MYSSCFYKHTAPTELRCITHIRKILKLTPMDDFLPATTLKQTYYLEFYMSVAKILDTKRTDPDADIPNLENEIDKLVCELYNLTEDEITIVEGKE